MRSDWLLHVEDAVAEVEAEKLRRNSPSNGQSMQPGMQEVRVNYHELESQQ